MMTVGLQLRIISSYFNLTINLEVDSFSPTNIKTKASSQKSNGDKQPRHTINPFVIIHKPNI